MTKHRLSPEPTPSTSTQPTPTLKVVLLGDSGVGKTCLRSQFVHHVFTNAYKATIGGDYLTTTVKLLPSNETTTNQQQQTPTNVNLQIWDTAGQERFNSISQAFYRGTDVCVLVYDVTNYESVLSLRDWFNRFIEYCHVDTPGVIIVGNKSDKVNERCVDMEEIRDIVTSNTTIANVGDYIEDWETCLLEVTAKKLEMVTTLFENVAKVGVELSASDVGAAKKRKLQQFDKIDLNHRLPTTNANTNDVTSSSCAC
ncbi:ypt71 Ypt/Rab-type GTPase ypt71 [Candida maltosa Xu316]|uniref:Uncharacterized protein n=1 Tax=Candida maltosa (strain Xu316) TaxID=1245528 RepID=M3HHD1_CANMX|nr:hypothetical protein G210_3047 [Candida maltosa Xu316]